MGDIAIALITIFWTFASVTGVAIYVFNGTRKMIDQMHKTQREMQKT